MADKKNDVVAEMARRKALEARDRQDKRAAALFNMGLTKEPYGERTPAQRHKDNHGERKTDVRLK